MQAEMQIPISPIRAISELVPAISQQRPYGKNRPVLNGTVGEPTHAMEPEVIDEMQKTLEERRGTASGYTSFFGDPAYRGRIAAVINNEYATRGSNATLGYAAENVLMSVGASSGLQAAMFALASPKVPVVTPTPFYLLYKSQADLAHAELIPIEVADSAYKITPEKLEKTFNALAAKQGVPPGEVRANLVLDYPGNPIGTMLSEDEWKGIANTLRKYPKVNIMLDEIYRDVIVAQDTNGKPKQYTSLLHVAPDLKDRTLMFFSGSKGPALAGERIGAVVGPKEMIGNMATIQFPVVVHPSRTAQAGFAKAMEMISQKQGVKKKISDYYKERIDIVRNGLGEAVIPANVEGAFYVVADLKGMIGKPFSEKARAHIRVHPENFKGLDTGTIQTDKQIALHMLFDHGVAITPASAFGYKGEEGKMRIAATATPAQLKEMVAEINAALGKGKAEPASVLGKVPASMGVNPSLSA